MFRIPDMIDEFRVFYFIFEDGVEFQFFIYTYQIELVVFQLY